VSAGEGGQSSGDRCEKMQLSDLGHMTSREIKGQNSQKLLVLVFPGALKEEEEEKNATVKRVNGEDGSFFNKTPVGN